MCRTCGSLARKVSHCRHSKWRVKLTCSTELAARRGLRTWPRGASWPAEVHPSHLHANGTNVDAEPKEEDIEARAASKKLASIQESALAEQTYRQTSADERCTPDRECWPPR